MSDRRAVSHVVSTVPPKALGALIILLTLVAIGYATYIAIRYWSGIGV
mgnify:CR=1 FL=1